MKVHYYHQRLKVNAGTEYPLCRGNDELLDTGLRVLVTYSKDSVTCKHCLKAMGVNYNLFSGGAK